MGRGPGDMLERARPACVRVSVMERGTGRVLDSGSGFVVAHGWVATCWHVVNNSSGRVLSLLFDGSSEAIEALLADKDEEGDCALLRFDPSQTPAGVEALPLAGTLPGVDARWWGYGFPVSTRQAPDRITGEVRLPDGHDDRGQIADVLQARGELDEALRIRREEELPVYERLGDVRLRAVTQGRIADVLQARGEFDEALRIVREEVLPVYERLGARRELLVGRAWLALLLLRLDRPGDREEAAELLRLALADARAMKLPEADRILAIMQRHGIA